MDKNVLIILCVYLTQADQNAGLFSLQHLNTNIVDFWYSGHIIYLVILSR